MEKLKMESVDITQKNIERIGNLFPNVITETKDENGVLKKAINFTLLKQELSDDVIDGEECYDFTWVGKKASIVEGNTPIRKTLRPCIEESKDFETTGNLYIEGDNLDVLKLLQESYLNSIKMIYIDPPYNTGNDFIYRDNFTINKDAYDEQLGMFDEEENRLFQNNESNGRFHSDWCSMILPRLKLAHNLLREDGVVFISIDDNEVDNLKKICNEVFGESNFIAQIIWKKRSTPPNDKIIGAQHEYILVFCKNTKTVVLNLKKRNEEQIARYKNPDNHPKGAWTSGDLMANVKGGRYVASLYYQIINPRTGQEHFPSSNGNWRFNRAKIEDLIKNNEIYFGEDDFGRPKLKRFLTEVKEGITWSSLWDFVPLNTSGSQEMTNMFGNLSAFDNPKPSGLLTELIKLGSSSSDIILDFFSGSATTAHAVMQLNAEDGGNRKFIMVQLPEVCDEKSEAYKAGCKNICEIGKERIRRAGEKIKAENPQSASADSPLIQGALTAPLNKGGGTEGDGGFSFAETYDEAWLKQEGLAWTGKSLPYNPKLQERASELRKAMTKEENKLWYEFLAKHERKFLRQKVVGHYIVDFYCAEYRLAIEVDGSQHYTEQGMLYDNIREEYLDQFKIKIIRFTNDEVRNKFKAVCYKIEEQLNPQSASADSPLIQGALLVESSETIVASLVEQSETTVALLAEQGVATIAQAPLNKGGGTEGDWGLDIGFRVLKIDDTNMNDVYYAANEYKQDMLLSLESNIKDDRTDLDLLYGVLLDWGLPLSLNHKIEQLAEVTLHTVDQGSLVACFSENVSEQVVREIAKRQPLRVVFRDSSFANSPDKINVEEIFKLHSPNTSIKVI